MPFSSRKNKNAASSIHRANNTGPSRLNPFARLYSTLSDDSPKLAPTSNPFETLIEEEGTEEDLKPNDNTKELNDLTEDMESFAVDIISDDCHERGQNTVKASESTRTEAPEHPQEIAESKGGWRQTMKNPKRLTCNTDRGSTYIGPATATPTRVHRSNWQKSGTDAALNSPTWRGTRTTTGTVVTNQAGYDPHRGFQKIFFGISVSQLVVGAIFYQNETRECYDNKVEGDVFKSNDGQLHLRKGRYFVIKAVHAYIITKSPMFTYEGMGIKNKCEQLKKEHVGVRPLNMSAEKYVKQNGYAPLEIEYLEKNQQDLHEKTVLRFTESSTTSFHADIRMVGRLTPKSVAYLATLRAKFGC